MKGTAVGIGFDRTERISQRHFAIFVAAALIGAFACPALADDPEAAKSLFDQGIAEMGKENYAVACPALKESLKLSVKPGTLFTLAFCELKWGHLATADAYLEEYLRVYDTLSAEQKKLQLDRDRPRLAMEERAKIRQDIPTLTLSLAPNAPPGTVVTNNAQVVESAGLNVALPLDPGEYVLSAYIPGGPVKEEKITLGKGDHRSIVLEVLPKPEPPKPEPPKPEPPKPEPPKPELPSTSASSNAPLKPAKNDSIKTQSSPKPVLPGMKEEPSNSLVSMALLSGGVGFVAIVLGGVLGNLAKDQFDILRVNCGQAIGKSDPAVCNKTGFDAAQSLKPLATASTISFIAGGIGLATGVTLYILSPSSSNTKNPQNPQNSKTGASPSISVGILSTTPTSILFGSRGSF